MQMQIGGETGARSGFAAGALRLGPMEALFKPDGTFLIVPEAKIGCSRPMDWAANFWTFSWDAVCA